MHSNPVMPNKPPTPPMPPMPSKAEKTQTWQAINLLRSAAAPEKRHLRHALLWLIVAAALEAMIPILGKTLIDDHLLTHRLDWQRIITILVCSLLLGTIASIVRYLQLVRLSGLAMRSVRRLRERVYEHVLALPMAFFDRAITGQLVSRVTNDTEAVKALYVQVLFVMLDNGIILFGAMCAMAWLDWRLMLIVLTLVPAVIAIVWLYQRLSAPAVAQARQLRSDINAQVAESIGGMSLLQANNATVRYGERFAATNRAQYQARLAELRANAWLLRPALDLLNVALLAIVIYSFGQRPLSGLEVGVLYAFVNYIARVVEPLIQITLQFSQLQQSIVAAARVNTLLRENSTDAQRIAHDCMPAGAPATISKGALAIRAVEFAYNPGQPILNDFSLTIPAGAFFGIVGHTGSGKSTLLSLLLRYYQPQSGSIDIDGIGVDHIGNDAFRADVGLVPQDPFLLAASAFENIDMGRGFSQAEIEAAARKAKAHDFIVALENGYQTDLGEGGGRLSTGQKQLIAIARALAGQPKILFLDEATSHIDSETEQVVQTALNELRGSVTIVAIAHRLSTIREADTIVVLNHGHIAESGTHEALMQVNEGIYQRLYLLQQLVE
jgi:ATP-binding cassette subfamily B multidrug efflux pump